MTFTSLYDFVVHFMGYLPPEFEFFYAVATFIIFVCYIAIFVCPLVMLVKGRW